MSTPAPQVDAETPMLPPIRHFVVRAWDVTAFRITLIYVLCGVAWILASDRLLAALVHDVGWLSDLQTFKGWFYVCCSGLLIYVLILRAFAAVKESEQGLRESQGRFTQLADNVHEAFWLLSVADQQIIYVSPAYERITGLSCASLYAEPRLVIEAVLPEDQPLLAAAMAQATGGERTDTEYRYVDRAGTCHWIHTQYAPVYDAAGQVYRIAGVSSDITARKQAELDRATTEAHYRRLVQASPYGIVVIDNQGCITEVNLALAAILGYPSAALLGRHFGDLLPQATAATTRHLFDTRLASDPGFAENEYRIKRPDGSERLLKTRTAAIDEGGTTVGMHAVVQDITEERARDQQMRLLATALEGLQEAVSIVDGNGRLHYANAAHRRLFGYAAEHSSEQHAATFCPDQATWQQLSRIMQQVAQDGMWKGRLLQRRVDGDVFPAEMIVGTVAQDDDEALCLIISQDAAAEIAREEQLRRAERLASLGTLLSGVAHELNNPLASIKAFAQLLLMEERTPADQEALTTILQEADRTAHIVADLRRVARESQHTGTKRVTLQLNETIRYLLKLRRYTLATNNIAIVEHLDPNIPPVWVDRHDLEQVLLNLIVNAEHAMANRPLPQALTLRTVADGVWIRCELSDTGAGIAPEHLDRIWDPFFTTKAPGEGMGLGLSLVHGLVIAHGWRIGVASTPAQGTTFVLQLPVVSDVVPSLSPVPELAAPLRPLRILLVDDEEPIRRAIGQFLLRRGHTVVEAEDGQAALDAIAATTPLAPYDLVLADLRMPGLSGEDLFAELRQRGDGSERRLIMLTGDATNPRTIQLFDQVAVPVLLKPFDLATVARTVERQAELIRS